MKKLQIMAGNYEQGSAFPFLSNMSISLFPLIENILLIYNNIKTFTMLMFNIYLYLNLGLFAHEAVGHSTYK